MQTDHMLDNETQETNRLKSTVFQALALIENLEPKSMLVGSDSLAKALRNAEASCDIIELYKSSDLLASVQTSIDQWVKNIDCVLLESVLNDLNTGSAIALVGLIRNQLNAKILIVTDQDGPLSFQDLLGLGFQRSFINDVGQALYTYDIANYNKKRDWNNSRFWANPENFNKYRW